MQVLSLNGLIYDIQTDFFAFFGKINKKSAHRELKLQPNTTRN
jgi:hypothetical protein